MSETEQSSSAEPSTGPGERPKATATVSAEAIRDFVNATDALAVEHPLDITEDGLVVEAVDAANISQYYVTLPVGIMEDNRLAEGEVGFDTTALREMLDNVNLGSEVDLHYNYDSKSWVVSNENIHLCAGHTERDSLSGKEPEDIGDDFESSVSIKAGKLADCVEPAHAVDRSPHVTIDYSPDGMHLFEVDVSIGHNSVIGQFEDEDLESHEGDRARARYKASYLADMLSPIPRDAVVELKLANEYPLSLSTTTASGVEIQYYLAPKIGEN